MRIAIFETEHFEVAYPVIKLFDDNTNHITVFVYEAAYRQLAFLFGDDMQRYAWVVKDQQASTYAFLYRMYLEIKNRNIELLYINTLSDNYLLYYALVRLLNIRTVLTLHDINAYFSNTAGFSLRSRLNYAGRKLLVARLQEFNVIATTMAGYLKRKLPNGKKVYCIPGGIYEPTLQASALPALAGELHIVVPGTIDNRRRDYNLVFNLLTEAARLSLPVHITLLGGHYGGYGQQMMERCKAYRQQYSNLQFYDIPVVDQPEFNRVMACAHLLLMPSVTDNVLFGHAEEKYGLSKSSGNLFDAVRYAMPFIAPAALPVDAYLEAACIRYHDVQELIQRLQQLVQHPERYATLQQHAISASMHYSVAEIRRHNPGILS